MGRLPSGTVTLLFSDVEGSTRLLEEQGDAYAGVLGEYRRLLREAASRHGGVEVDTQGDAYGSQKLASGTLMSPLLKETRESSHRSGP